MAEDFGVDLFEVGEGGGGGERGEEVVVVEKGGRVWVGRER